MYIYTGYIIYRLERHRVKKEWDVRRESLLFLFLLYLLWLIEGSREQITLIISDIQSNQHVTDSYLYGLNRFWQLFTLLPLGLFLPLIFSKMHKFVNLVMAGCLIALSLEYIHIQLTSHRFHFDYIAFNTLGTLLGFIILKFYLYRIKPNLNDLVQV
ncbi:MAG: VanZ family protein [Turicibacter sp.]